MTDNITQYKDLMATIERQVTSHIERNAKVFRREVIIPFCEKYELDFYCGNGTWFFVPRNCDRRFTIDQHTEDYQLEDEGLSIELLEPLKEIDAVLNTCAFQDLYLQYFMESYQK